MQKLLCERPRIGSRNPSLKTALRLDPNLDYDSGDNDWGPSRLPCSRKRQYGHEAKRLNENLTPLEQFLETAVGRPWDEVYSEIRERIDMRKAIGLHVMQHLEHMVEVNVFMENGVPFESKATYGSWHEVYGLYVHPETGLLTRHKNRVKYRKAKEAITRLHWYGNTFYELKTTLKTPCCGRLPFGYPPKDAKNDVYDRYRNRKAGIDKYCLHGIEATETKMWYVVEYGYHSPDEVFKVIRYGDWQASNIGLTEGQSQVIYYRDRPNEMAQPFVISTRSANKKHLKHIRSNLY